jgi:hypothetical protein
MNPEELADALDRAGGHFPAFVNALDAVFKAKRDSLHEAIDRLDDECGELQPHVREAIGRFIDAVWRAL